jgi:hypothetical protein
MAYSQFHDGFWTDPEIRQLSSDDKMILIWFITNPARHYSGIYFFELESIGKQTGLPEKTVRKGIDTLSAIGFLKYNPKFSMVWVCKMARHEVVKSEKTGLYSDKQTKGIANHFEKLHKCPLIKDFLEYYPDMNIPYQYGIRQEEVEVEVKAEEKEEAEDTPLNPPKNGGSNSFNFNTLAKLWNEKAPVVLPRVKLPFSRSPKDLKKLSLVLKRHPGSEYWIEVLDKLKESPFLLGQNDRGWTAGFDFMVERAEKIMDGKYASIPKGFAGPINWLEKRRGKDEARG